MQSKDNRVLADVRSHRKAVWLQCGLDVHTVHIRLRGIFKPLEKALRMEFLLKKFLWILSGYLAVCMQKD